MAALDLLARRKGYKLIGCNSAGNNAYFIRNDKIDNVPILNVKDAFVEGRWRDSRDKQGRLTYLSSQERFKAIAHLEVYDLKQNNLATLGSLK